MAVVLTPFPAFPAFPASLPDPLPDDLTTLTADQTTALDEYNEAADANGMAYNYLEQQIDGFPDPIIMTDMTNQDVEYQRSQYRQARRESHYGKDIDRMAMAASCKIEQYAPGAPQPNRDEAMVRYVAYLFQAQSGAHRKTEKGQVDGYDAQAISTVIGTVPVVNHAAAFHNCGAKALLTGWKVRRAGAA